MTCWLTNNVLSSQSEYYTGLDYSVAIWNIQTLNTQQFVHYTAITSAVYKIIKKCLSCNYLIHIDFHHNQMGIRNDVFQKY